MNYEIIIKDNRAVVFPINEEKGDKVTPFDDGTTTITTKKVELCVPTVNSITVEGDLSIVKDLAASLVGQGGLLTVYESLESTEKTVQKVQEHTSVATYRLKNKQD